MDKFREISKAKTGDKICLFGEARAYKVMARSERFVILSKQCFGKPLYTIVDLKEEWMGPDYLIFGDYDYSSPKDCERAVKDLESGELEISRRRGMSFYSYISKGESRRNDRRNN